MEGYVRIGLLLIVAVALGMIFLGSWHSRRRLNAKQGNLPIVSLGTVTEPFVSVKQLTDNHLRQPRQKTTNTHVVTQGYKAAATLQQHKIKKIPIVKRTPEKGIDDFLIMSVVAKPGCPFASYDLLQSISATGMCFGEMNIFHYYLLNATDKTSLFSLASATEPGEFDLDRIGGFSCEGLTLFMDLRRLSDPAQAFELMLNTAMQLVEDLDGELRAGQRTPWSEGMAHSYRQRALQYGISN